MTLRGARAAWKVPALGLGGIAFLSAVAGCERPARAEVSPAAAARLFAARCAKCHGALGAADGPDTSQFLPRPHSFADPAWQARVEDAWLSRIIVFGGPSVGRSAAMPPNPDLKDDPLLPLLVVHLRSLAHSTDEAMP